MLLLAAAALAPNRVAGKEITRVFIVFSNHLDVGYTKNDNGSDAGAVVNECVIAGADGMSCYGMA